MTYMNWLIINSLLLIRIFRSHRLVGRRHRHRGSHPLPVVLEVDCTTINASGLARIFIESGTQTMIETCTVRASWRGWKRWRGSVI